MIGIGVHILHIYVCGPKKIESYFSDRLTFSNIHGITLYPQISSFVAVNNYQSDNFHHKTNTPLVALGEWPTELKDRQTEQGSRDLRKSYLKLEFTEHIANGEPFLKRSFSHSYSLPVLQRFCLSSGLPKVMV